MKKTFDIESLFGNIESSTLSVIWAQTKQSCVAILPNSSMFVRLSVFGHLIMESVRKLGNICSGHKMFLNKIRNIFLSRTQHLCPQQWSKGHQQSLSIASGPACASLSSWYQLLPMDLISASNERLQVICGWLLFRLGIFQVKACLVMVQEAFR